MHPYSPEERLILLCARTVFDEEQRGQIQSYLKTDLRWEEVLRLTERHRLISFVTKALCHSDEESIPPEPVREKQRDGNDNRSDSDRN